ncbi:hypothetical protein [Nonomuraea endophytica]|uniref:hypothetical protein n=1 Tax=Nonomuraea endophytica TaxID=714136 RepID=UPI0037C9ADB3
MDQSQSGPAWTEDEYVAQLRDERRRFTWVIRQHGGLVPAAAEEAALQRYPYEAEGTPYRGMIFHDEAWHWAMLKIYGDNYVVDHPELGTPSADYRALD